LPLNVLYFFSLFFSLLKYCKIDRQHGTVARGRLAQLLTEGPSPNPRWLIKFEKKSYKDEEMYERAFKALIHSNEDVDERKNHSTTIIAPQLHIVSRSTPSPDNTKVDGSTPSEGGNSDDAKEGNKGNSSSVSSSATMTTSKTVSSKSVQFHKGDTASNEGSDDSSPNEENSGSRKARYRASQREARSRRRQAKIETSSKKIKPNEQQYAGNGEVVKVALKTGTLYLYRGTHRRVEFVRRV
jgi:hypothetical protein